jgi:hypothetical protein
MNKTLAAVSILLATFGASEAHADDQCNSNGSELVSQMPKTPFTSGVPASAFGGEFLFPSNNPDLVAHSGYFHLNMQPDGNLVTYAGPGDGAAWWASGTNNTDTYCGNGIDCFYSVLQPDGNFAIWDALSQQPIWSTGTTNRAGDVLIQQDDGNLVIYYGSTALWASGHHEGNQTFNPCAASNSWTVLSNIGNTGNQYRLITNMGVQPQGSGFAACGIICNDDPSCVAFNYNPANEHCGLISSNGVLQSHNDFVTGFRNF